MTAPHSARFPYLILLLAALAGCRGREDAGVHAARGVRLPAPVGATASLALDARGRVWVADSGRLVVLDTAGAVVARADLGTPAPARAVGMDTAALYFRAGSRILAVDPDSVRVRARRTGVVEGAFAADPLGGDAYLATGR
ncbi:MAG TPA: hypothetical protein VHG28_06690, partial [Longimicrobiaceae bacterium]|nr:hypothetical protein [Longimicrobiaceae bacterium]